MENNVFNTQLGNLNTTNSFSSNFTFFCRNFLFLPSNINLYNHKKGRNLVWGVGGGSFCSKCEKFVKREILSFSNISWWKSCNFYSFYLFLKISSRSLNLCRTFASFTSQWTCLARTYLLPSPASEPAYHEHIYFQ